MTRQALILTVLLAATSCSGDETLRAYGAADKVWVLTALDGQPFASRATITFPEAGKIAGQAPCNHFSGAMTAPYPWFETGPLAATKMACPELDAEIAFFTALTEMTQAEVLGNTMILSTEDGREMLFKAGD